MTDDRGGVVLVFLDELLRAREGDLVDILVNLLGRHTDTTIRDRDRTVVELHADCQVAHLALELANRGQCFQLLGRVDSVRHQLTQEDLMITIQEFLNDREYILRCYSNVSLRAHIIFLFYLYA